MLMETAEHLADMSSVLQKIAVRINQDVIEIDDNRDIQHVAENVIHESLKHRRCVSETLGDDQPFKGPIFSVEHRFLFITIHYANKMVSVAEVNLGVKVPFTQGV